MWITVVFPAPLGPSSPSTRPPRDRQADAIERGGLAERLGQLLSLEPMLAQALSTHVVRIACHQHPDAQRILWQGVEVRSGDRPVDSGTAA
jgi:hypothetical protein